MQDINTTINMKMEILEMISNASSAINISINRIITLLIIRLIHNKKLKLKMFTSIKYQATGDDIKWHRLHVSLSTDIYEKALDLRKVLKMSVSFIIAKAVENILNEIINEYLRTNKTDNYFRNYVFIPNYQDGVLYFTIFWQYPPDDLLTKFIESNENQ
jgi:hypothetical protein